MDRACLATGGRAARGVAASGSPHARTRSLLAAEEATQGVFDRRTALAAARLRRGLAGLAAPKPAFELALQQIGGGAGRERRDVDGELEVVERTADHYRHGDPGNLREILATLPGRGRDDRRFREVLHRPLADIDVAGAREPEQRRF